MSAGGRLLLALAAALLLHALALAAAASWLPTRPAVPPELASFSVSDASPGTPPRVTWTLHPRGPRPAADATLRVVLRGSETEDATVEQEFPLGRVNVGAEEGHAGLELPADAAGPWTAEASVRAVGSESSSGPSAGASFWVDDGRPGDLAVEDLDSGGTTASAGGGVRAAWTRVNRGPGWLRGGGRDAVLVSVDEAVVAATSARGFPPLPPAGRSTHTTVLGLPEDLSGVATLRVEVDAGRSLPEPHGPENAAEVPLLIEPSPFPDLAAVRLDVGEAATLREGRDQAARRRQDGGPLPVLAGRPLPVRLVVENLRPAEAPAARRDAVVLSRDRTLDPGDLPLASFDRADPIAGRGRDAASGEVVIPEAWASPSGEPATAFLLGIADADGEIGEGDPSLRGNNAVAVEVAVRRPPEEPDDTPLGEDEAEPRLTVAWIPHDAFEELRARKRRTLQPAVQASAAPVPDAPAREATAPPVPPRPPSPPRADPSDTAAPAPPPAAGDPAAPGAVLPAPGPAEQPAPNPRTVAENPPEAPRSADPAERPSDTPAAPPTPPPAPEGPAEPTSAPRAESEADPTADADATELRPGRVEVGPGLTVEVRRPRIDPVAVLSTVVHPPRVSVTFDVDGTVLHAQVIRSAGSNAVDAPILRSLYRWTASGDRLETWDGPKTFEFTFLFDR